MRILSFIKKAFNSKLQNILDTETSPDNIKKHFETLIQASKVLQPSIVKPTQLQFGEYSITGSNPAIVGTDYFGTISLKKSGSKVNAVWQIGFTRDIQTGEGFQSQGLLCLNFHYLHNKIKYEGKVIYQIQSEKLTGYWLESGCNHTGIEVAKLKRIIN